MENIKLIVDGVSVGSLSIDNDGIVNDIFVHKTSPEETLQIISEHALLGKKVNSEKYYIITTWFIK